MKLKHILSLTLILPFTFMGIYSQAQNTVLTGTLKGLSNGTVQLFYSNNNHWITDTVTASNDRFTWKTHLTLPTRIGLKADTLYYYFFAAPGHLTLTGITDSLPSYVLTGSPMQRDANRFKQLTSGLTSQWNTLFQQYQTATEAQKKVIDKKRDSLGKQNERMVSLFIKNHPGSLYSMYLIGLEKEYADINRLYKLLDNSARQTAMGRNIAKRLHLLAKRQIGQQMPDFTQPDTSGHLVNFNTFRSGYKYILVDFWASWCAPCRAENPNVLKAYNKYKDKGFTVIGISVDDNAANWKRAIIHDKMPWTQLSDLKGWENKLSTALGIEFIPSNLLIDASGKIIAKDLRGSDLENKLKKLLD